mmetsp:Transcript_14338/g.21734  ORF Transcript_14338/g.21734 Transcript_14338/m.21734 type:complete len:80 (-) Transcript_14338:2290-2529(-)
MRRRRTSAWANGFGLSRESLHCLLFCSTIFSFTIEESSSFGITANWSNVNVEDIFHVPIYSDDYMADSTILPIDERKAK